MHRLLPVLQFGLHPVDDLRVLRGHVGLLGPIHRQVVKLPAEGPEFVLMLALPSAIGVTASLATDSSAAEAKSVKVFILAGQSHMEGKAANTLLEGKWIGSVMALAMLAGLPTIAKATGAKVPRTSNAFPSSSARAPRVSPQRTASTRTDSRSRV